MGKIWEIEIKDTRGKTVGYKYVRGTSPEDIKGHPSRHVGSGRKIGKVYPTMKRKLAGEKPISRKPKTISYNDKWKSIFG